MVAHTDLVHARAHAYAERHKPHGLHIQCLLDLCEVPSTLGKGPAQVRQFPMGGQEQPGADIWSKFWFPSALLRAQHGGETLGPVSLLPPSPLPLVRGHISPAW